MAFLLVKKYKNLSSIVLFVCITSCRSMSLGNTSFEVGITFPDTTFNTTKEKGRLSILETQEIDWANLDNGPIIIGGPNEEEIEYEVGKVLRCATIGSPRPEVAWEYYGKFLPDDFLYESEDITDASYYDEEYWKLMNAYKRLNKTKRSLDRESINFNPKEEGLIRWVDLKLPKLNMAIYGELECVAENDEGVISKFYYIKHNANSSVFMKLLRTSVAGVIVTIAVLSYKYSQWKAEQKKNQRYQSLALRDLQIVQKFQNGEGVEDNFQVGYPLKKNKSCVSTTTAETTLNESFSIVEIAINSWIDLDPYNTQREIQKGNFKLYEEDILQTGEFGVLVKGKIRCPKTLKYDTVAVLKAFQSRQDDDEENGISLRNFENVLKEIKTLAKLPNDNPFIVNFEAAYTKELYKKKAFLFLEYCEIGALDDFLYKNAHQFRDLLVRRNTKDVKREPLPNNRRRPSCTGYIHESKEDLELEEKVKKKGILFTTEDLLLWSAMIAEGMKYLHKHNVVHGNLSTSCVYLTEQFVAKVGKIGLPPNTSFNDNDKLSPPESNSLPEYSMKWDVWSYGNTLWQIFSLMKRKLPSFQDLSDFHQLRKPLNFPENSCKEINATIEDCWKPEPNSRPNFLNLCESMRHFVQIFKLNG